MQPTVQMKTKEVLLENSFLLKEAEFSVLFRPLADW
jgi:hypothetical protein